MVFILNGLENLHSIKLRNTVNHKPILNSSASVIFKTLKESPFLHKVQNGFKIVLVKIVTQTRDRMKEKVTARHALVQLAHQFFRMEYIKRIVQNVHVENTFVRFTQRFSNFGIFSALFLSHASCIPDHADKIQQNHEQFHRRYTDIESANFIDTRKGDSFVYTQDKRPAPPK